MRPLDGIKVVDFSRVLAGPMATQILADSGAEVIKVERPGKGDESRTFAPFFDEGQSAYYSAFNRGKTSIAIDLRNSEGQAIALELAAQADVLVENFLPGTMDRMGLGYETLRAINPGLVYVSNTGFGQTGPYKDRKGYDTVFQALSGVIDLTGFPDGPPAKVGVPFADMTSGLWIAISALTGLMGRQVSGQGCHVDLSMMDVQVSLLSLPSAWYFADGITPTRTGTEHLGRVPSAAFECTGGEWIFISASDQHWAALVDVLDLTVPQSWSEMAVRVAEREEVMRVLRAAIRERDRSVLAEALRRGDVPVGEVNTVPEILADPHTQSRGIVGSFDDTNGRPTPALGTPGRYSGFDGPRFQAPPELGQQTTQILRKLGRDADDIEELKRKGVVA
ncbi:CaiB/BaiF CoA-transferase family protein [Celeribacter sp. PS-C1]|uniref:CaiB/BaiF CoA transferase family protein n=1 Tax=Celeribacter sp. PS-C1 TaxID=2820813 RepID=UPI001C675225|nr:CaiB/BaiF CoA-transferase family protein [Celeribacter sp. PS-C1]MBW6417032.1 CoA transferase [Celeribacter sp. PS-C1]